LLRERITADDIQKRRTVENVAEIKEELKVYYKIYEVLVNTVSSDCIHMVQNVEKVPFEVWRSINEAFCPISTASVRRTRRQFYVLKMNSDHNVLEFAQRINSKVKELEMLLSSINRNDEGMSVVSNSRESISELEKLSVLLGGLSAKFETIRIILENTPNVTFEGVICTSS